LNRRILARVTSLVASVVVAPLAVVGLNAAPALATAHCSSSGKPISTSGKFTNNTGHTMMVKGDALVNGAFKTVERAIGKEGGTAWGAGICDADFFKAYSDFISNGVVYDGDVYKKMTLTWECHNFAVQPGTPVNTECG
jgi:hypothetical protein